MVGLQLQPVMGNGIVKGFGLGFNRVFCLGMFCRKSRGTHCLGVIASRFELRDDRSGRRGVNGKMVNV